MAIVLFHDPFRDDLRRFFQTGLRRGAQPRGLTLRLCPDCLRTPGRPFLRLTEQRRSLRVRLSAGAVHKRLPLLLRFRRDLPGLPLGGGSALTAFPFGFRNLFNSLQ